MFTSFPFYIDQVPSTTCIYTRREGVKFDEGFNSEENIVPKNTGDVSLFTTILPDASKSPVNSNRDAQQDEPKAIRCDKKHSSCFTLWLSDPNNSTQELILAQGTFDCGAIIFV